MTKRELSAILAKASTEETAELAGKIKRECEIKMLKEPQKTLVMVKVRESVKNSLFYLGEILATECMVTVNGVRGMTVIAGDDFKKAVDAAVIDGYLNCVGETKASVVIDKIRELGRKQAEGRAALNRQLRKSKVNFNVMGE